MRHAHRALVFRNRLFLHRSLQGASYSGTAASSAELQLWGIDVHSLLSTFSISSSFVLHSVIQLSKLASSTQNASAPLYSKPVPLTSLLQHTTKQQIAGDEVTAVNLKSWLG